MNKYNKLFMDIRACFPEASSISISINTSQKEIDSFKEEVTESTKDSILTVMTMDNHEVSLSDNQFFRYGNPLGDIKLTHNGN